MSTKTIAISKEAYERLKALKSEKESFTDVINKMTGRVKLTDFAGLLSEKEARELEESIRKMRYESNMRARKTKEKLS